MAGLKAWVKKYLRPKSTIQEHPKDHQLPFLLASRRPVTPTVFDTPTCLFFQLPYDIRSIIVLMALGNRALHMDLELQERGWQWRGALCESGRRNPSRLPFERNPLRHPFGDLWRDDCVSVRPRYGEYFSPGVTGFLLSCKQAYAEGIYVLWSTNTILITSEPLLLYLPSLVVPDRLNVLASLEIRLHPLRYNQPTNGLSNILGLDPLQPILSNIKTHCPRLRSFVLSFLPASNNERLAFGPTLSLIDDFYRSMRLREMRVEVPYFTLSQLRCDILPYQEHPREETPESWQMRLTSWRALDGDEPRVEGGLYERYSGPPLRLPRSENEDEFLESKGYWLVMGEDIRRPYYFSRLRSQFGVE